MRCRRRTTPLAAVLIRMARPPWLHRLHSRSAGEDAGMDPLELLVDLLDTYRLTRLGHCRHHQRADASVARRPHERSAFSD